MGTAILSATGAFAETFYVCASGCASGEFRSIQAAIDAASDGDEILVRAGTYTASGGDAVVDLKGKELVLCSCDGPEVTIIDGEFSRRGIFCSTNETADTRIDGFTVINGWTEELGGGLYIYRASPTIVNCVFRDNQAKGGGGICLENSVSVVSDCIFAENQTSETVDDLHDGRGGGIFVFQGSPTIRSCFVAENEAVMGGGIYMRCDYSTVVEDCTVVGNMAHDSGGGLYSFSGGISYCTFLSNNAVNDGGGAYIRGGTRLISCLVESNSAEHGGGVFGYTLSYGVRIRDTEFVSNQASDSGGGFYGYRGSGWIEDCSFEENGAYIFGGAVASYMWRGQIDRGTFTSNTANSGGGAFFIDQASVRVIDSLVHANSGLFGGGALVFNAPMSSSSNPIFSGVIFSENIAAGGGGAIFNMFDVAATCTDCSFVRNEAVQGGAIASYADSMAEVRNSNFCENVPQHVFGPWEDVDNCMASSCTDIDDDGVPDECETNIFVDDDGSHFPDAEYTVIQDAIDAAVDGDVITVAEGVYTATDGPHVVDMKGKEIILQSHLGSGSTIIDGGGVRRGIVCYSGEMFQTVIEGFTVLNCTGVDFDFDGDGGVDAVESVGGGGMMLYNRSSPTIRECVFRDNERGMYNGQHCSPRVESCSFISNEASDGAGMFNSQDSDPRITDCRFERNNATAGVGGGIFTLGGDPRVSSCHFENNTSFLGGGAAACIGENEAEFSMCSFINNSSATEGGGAVSAWSGADLEFDRCTFEGNSARLGGAVWHSEDSRSYIDICSFSENIATDFGGAIYNESHGGYVTRSDFCGNLPTHIHGSYSDGWANSFADTCLDAACVSVAGVFQVPSDVPTITQAIACAVDGDVIEVGPGFYSEAIDFQGKRITIEATQGPTATYLDGSGLVGTSLVTFSSGESTDSVLRGFTLFGSSAGTVDANTNQLVGGAIYVYGASPTIEECIIAYNSSGVGGGAYLRYSESTIMNCFIRGNSAVNGGGLAIVDSNLMLLDLEFTGNEATNFGGGLAVGMTGQAPGNVLLDGCVMRWNSAGASGGGIAVSLQQSQFGVILTGTTVCSNEPDSIDGVWFDQGGNTVCGCMGDITGDGAVNGADLAGMLGAWGPVGDTVTELADLDASGEVDGADLALILGLWGACQ